MGNAGVDMFRRPTGETRDGAFYGRNIVYLGISDICKMVSYKTLFSQLIY